MRSLVLTIQGTVQKIGLKSSVLELAKSHEWKGEIKNQGDNEVFTSSPFIKKKSSTPSSFLSWKNILPS
jgi:hydrogenase maturation factor HypF (carbamoyltransferase family)